MINTCSEVTLSYVDDVTCSAMDRKDQPPHWCVTASILNPTLDLWSHMLIITIVIFYIKIHSPPCGCKWLFIVLCVVQYALRHVGRRHFIYLFFFYEWVMLARTICPFPHASHRNTRTQSEANDSRWRWGRWHGHIHLQRTCESDNKTMCSDSPKVEVAGADVYK